MDRPKRMMSHEYTGPEYSSAEVQAQKRCRQQSEQLCQLRLTGQGGCSSQIPFSLRRVQSAPVDAAIALQQETWDDLEHWRSREDAHRPCPDQMSRVQPEITPAMRAKLVDWMAEVRDEFRLHGETFFLAVHFLDRYLCTEGVGRQRFQLLGMACLWVAAKYEEVFVPHTDTVLAMAQNVYSSKDLQDMERRVLFALDFQLAVPTPLRLLHYLLQLAALPADPAQALSTRRLSEALLELSLLDPALSAARPSAVASAALYLALGLQQHLELLQPLVELSGADPDELGNLVKDLYEVLRRAQAMGPNCALLLRYLAWENLHGPRGLAGQGHSETRAHANAANEPTPSQEQAAPHNPYAGQQDAAAAAATACYAQYAAAASYSSASAHVHVQYQQQQLVYQHYVQQQQRQHYSYAYTHAPHLSPVDLNAAALLADRCHALAMGGGAAPMSCSS